MYIAYLKLVTSFAARDLGLTKIKALSVMIA